VCRLLAYLGTPTSPAPLVFGGEHSLYRQSWAPRELLSGSVNADGYGVVWYRDGRPARIAERRPIWYDSDLRGTLSGIESHCVFAALRNGTPGIPIDDSGQLPLLHERWSFTLNGFIPDFRRSHMRGLRAGLPDDLYAELRGSSDSETLFFLAVAALREGASMVDALTRTVHTVHGRVAGAEAQMNMVMCDGERLVGVRTGTRPVPNSLYVGTRPAFAAGGVVVASEIPEPSNSWDSVDPHTWVEIDMSGRVEAGRLARE